MCDGERRRARAGHRDRRALRAHLEAASRAGGIHGSSVVVVVVVVAVAVFVVIIIMLVARKLEATGATRQTCGPLALGT